MLNIKKEIEQLFDDFGPSLSLEDVFKAGYRAGLRANGYDVEDLTNNQNNQKHHWAEDVSSDCTDRGVYRRLVQEGKQLIDKMSYSVKSDFQDASTNTTYFDYTDPQSVEKQKQSIQELKAIILALQLQ